MNNLRRKLILVGGIAAIPISSGCLTAALMSGGDRENYIEKVSSVLISADGKTLAVESLWLAYSKPPIRAEDCALFLVDISKPQHKVTKVPIPLPPKDRPSPLGK